MIQEAARALWAVNETPPEFKVTGTDNLVITANISSSPLFIERNENGEYKLINESGFEIFRSRGLREAIVEACGVIYHDWLVSRLLD